METRYIKQLFVHFLKENYAYEKFILNIYNKHKSQYSGNSRIFTLGKLIEYNFSCYIDYAFTWDETNEGWDYWNDLNKKWINWYRYLSKKYGKYEKRN